MSPTRLLLIEDEPSIAENVVFALTTAHFQPVWCATGAAGLEAMGTGGFGLVILDIGLPDMSGFDVCRTIRAASRVPIIFLSARDEELDRVLGLELGADDYVTKPFSPRELVARVRAILRRSESIPASPPASTTGTGIAPTSFPENPPVSSASTASTLPDSAASPLIRHDTARKRVHCSGQPLDLTRHEYHLLLALLAHPGRVFSRDQLMDLAWEDPAASSDRTVDAHIKSLRAKLRAAAPGSDPIETRRGLGYALREEAVS
ncbi:MAG: creB [Verrucomicrobiales bacterium]|nr:creB [Verrucomicrobiales bacterium]